MDWYPTNREQSLGFKAFWQLSGNEQFRARSEFSPLRYQGLWMTIDNWSFKIPADETGSIAKIRRPIAGHPHLEDLSQLCVRAGGVLFAEAVKLYDNLCEDELPPFANMAGRLAKILLCAVADSIEDEFAAEALLMDIKRFKKIRRDRD